MTCPPAPPAVRRADPASRPTVPTPGITIYGCDPQEADLFRELAPRFGVRATVTEQPVTRANVDLAHGNRCISVDHRTAITGRTLRALRRAGVTGISTRSVGCDHIDTEYARELGITVQTVAYSPDSVADHTLMLMLMVLRDARSVVRRVDVHDYRLGDRRGRELRDLTVGVVGTGRIGTAVVARLRGFGCRVVAHDPRPTSDAQYVALDELVARSDVVTLHTPLLPETYHLLDRRRIGRLKPGAIVVNTGRGALVETRSLLAALEGGRLGGAALDVLEGEEGLFYADRQGTPVDRIVIRLHALPNVLISPHTAYYTEHALHDVVENTLLGCLDREGGEQHA